jgi:hypothetical protein
MQRPDDSEISRHRWLAVYERGVDQRFAGGRSAISMDGKGRWINNVFIERLWRSVTRRCAETLSAAEMLGCFSTCVVRRDEE